MSDPGGATPLPPPVVPPTTEPPAGVASGWQRVHPATPLLRSWQALAIAIVFFGQDITEGLLRGDRGGGVASGVTDSGVLGGLIGLVVLGAVLGMAFLSWQFTRYRVTPDALELHQGVVSRQQRRAPLDRLQAVDITEPLVARLFGLATLTLEVAGGGNSKIQLAYLTETEARRLRNHLLAAASGLQSDTSAPPEVGEAPEHHVITVPLERLIGSILVSGATVALALTVAGTIIGMVLTGQAGFAALLLPVGLTVGGLMWNQLVNGFGFRVAAAPDGVRLRHGMLEQRTQTVPPGRVQAIRLHQPLLWRLTGWWIVEVNVAGYGGGNASNGSAPRNRLLPVGTQAEAIAVLGFIVPGLEVDDADLQSRGDECGFTPAPRRARWVDPVGWRRHGFRVDEPALLVRGGRLHRHLDVVPHARTQSCGSWQGPIQRRLRLASFDLHSTPGPVAPHVKHLAVDVAADLLEQQSARARTARATARDEWLGPPTRMA